MVVPFHCVLFPVHHTTSLTFLRVMAIVSHFCARKCTHVTLLKAAFPGLSQQKCGCNIGL